MKNPINERVRYYRKKAGYTQNELAEKLGTKGSTYSQMEREGNIPAQRLLQIADVLGIEPSLLFEGEKPIIQSQAEEVPTIVKEPEFIPEPDLIEVYSQKEKNMMKIYRNLSQEKKNKFYEFLTGLMEE